MVVDKKCRGRDGGIGSSGRSDDVKVDVGVMAGAGSRSRRCLVFFRDCKQSFSHFFVLWGPP